MGEEIRFLILFRVSTVNVSAFLRIKHKSMCIFYSLFEERRQILNVEAKHCKSTLFYLIDLS